MLRCRGPSTARLLRSRSFVSPPVVDVEDGLRLGVERVDGLRCRVESPDDFGLLAVSLHRLVLLEERVDVLAEARPLVRPSRHSNVHDFVRHEPRPLLRVHPEEMLPGDANQPFRNLSARVLRVLPGQIPTPSDPVDVVRVGRVVREPTVAPKVRRVLDPRAFHVAENPRHVRGDFSERRNGLRGRDIFPDRPEVDGPLAFGSLRSRAVRDSRFREGPTALLRDEAKSVPNVLRRTARESFVLALDRDGHAIEALHPTTAKTRPMTAPRTIAATSASRSFATKSSKVIQIRSEE